MTPPEPILIENLRLRREEKVAADRRFIAQLLTCVEAGYPVARLARAIGLSRQSVHSLIKRRIKGWGERQP